MRKVFFGSMSVLCLYIFFMLIDSAGKPQPEEIHALIITGAVISAIFGIFFLTELLFPKRTGRRGGRK